MRHALPRWTQSIRFQLTLAYLFGLAAIFSLAGGLLYSVIRTTLLRQTGEALNLETARIAQILPTAGDPAGGKDEDEDAPSPAQVLGRIGPLTPAPPGLISGTLYVRLGRVSDNGTVATSASLSGRTALAESLARLPAPTAGHPAIRFAGPDEESKMRVESSLVPGTPYTLQVAIPWDQTEDFLTNLAIGIWGGILLFLVVSGI